MEKLQKMSMLIKALYGLRQAPRSWYVKLNQSLKSLGLVRCAYENTVCTRGKGNYCFIIAVYVDNILITGENVQKIVEFKQEM